MQHFFAMEKLSTYNIAFKGLKEGIHEFDYTIGNSFFELFEGSPVDSGKILAAVTMEKRSSYISLQIKISGTVSLICDRCLESYDQEVENEAGLFLKFGETHSEEGDDVIWLLPEEHQVNVARLIYEYIILSIPLRHVHPAPAHGRPGCDPEMLKKLREHSRHDPEATDERWDKLKNLLNNN